MPEQSSQNHSNVPPTFQAVSQSSTGAVSLQDSRDSKSLAVASDGSVSPSRWGRRSPRQTAHNLRAKVSQVLETQVLLIQHIQIKKLKLSLGSKFGHHSKAETAKWQNWTHDFQAGMDASVKVQQGLDIQKSATANSLISLYKAHLSVRGAEKQHAACSVEDHTKDYSALEDATQTRAMAALLAKKSVGAWFSAHGVKEQAVEELIFCLTLNEIDEETAKAMLAALEVMPEVEEVEEGEELEVVDEQVSNNAEKETGSTQGSIS